LKVKGKKSKINLYMKKIYSEFLFKKNRKNKKKILPRSWPFVFISRRQLHTTCIIWLSHDESDIHQTSPCLEVVSLDVRSISKESCNSKGSCFSFSLNGFFCLLLNHKMGCLLKQYSSREPFVFENENYLITPSYMSTLAFALG
jgi:hypothetical protein